MIFRNRPIGLLSAFDRLGGDGAFTEEDERLLQAFAASAATAVATAQTASNEALRRSMEASEQERRRWARELHDETLQELAGLKVLLSGARRSDDAGAARARRSTRRSSMITTGIANLRALITELRPAALDELGAEPALEALVERVARADRPRDRARGRPRLRAGPRRAAGTRPSSRSTIYRLVQEALTNVAKHAAAAQVTLRITDPEADAGPRAGRDLR